MRVSEETIIKNINSKIPREIDGTSGIKGKSFKEWKENFHFNNLQQRLSKSQQ